MQAKAPRDREPGDGEPGALESGWLIGLVLTVAVVLAIAVAWFLAHGVKS